MALYTQTSEISNAQFRSYVTYDDVTMMVDNVRIENDLTSVCRITIYDAFQPGVQITHWDAQPGEYRTWNLPKNRYNYDDYSYSFMVL
jgi:hypothetical protein